MKHYEILLIICISFMFCFPASLGFNCSTSCNYADWYPWGNCSTSCGVGTRTRWRAVCCRDTVFSYMDCLKDCNVPEKDSQENTSCSSFTGCPDYQCKIDKGEPQKSFQSRDIVLLTVGIATGMLASGCCICPVIFFADRRKKKQQQKNKIKPRIKSDMEEKDLDLEQYSL